MPEAVGVSSSAERVLCPPGGFLLDHIMLGGEPASDAAERADGLVGGLDRRALPNSNTERFARFSPPSPKRVGRAIDRRRRVPYDRAPDGLEIVGGEVAGRDDASVFEPVERTLSNESAIMNLTSSVPPSGRLEAAGFCGLSSRPVCVEPSRGA